MNDARFKRIKHGHLPGDVPNKTLIDMREKRTPTRLWFGTSWFQDISSACAKSFRKHIVEKGRTVQRRRDRRAIQEGLRENDNA